MKNILITALLLLSSTGFAQQRCETLFQPEKIVQELALLQIDIEQSADLSRALRKDYKRKYDLAVQSGVDLTTLPRLISELRKNKSQKDKETRERRQHTDKMESDLLEDPFELLVQTPVGLPKDQEKLFKKDPEEVSFAADDQFILVEYRPRGFSSLSDPSFIMIYDTATGAYRGRFPKDLIANRMEGQILGMTRNGSSAYGVSITSGNFVLVDLKTEKEIRSFLPNTLKPHAYKVSPDERIVAGLSKTGIVFWDFKTGQLLSEEPFVNTKAGRFQFSQDSSKIIANYGDSPAMLWDTSTRKEVARLNTDVWLTLPAPNKDGSEVFFATSNGKGPNNLLKWDIKAGTLNKVMTLPFESMRTSKSQNRGCSYDIHSKKIAIFHPETGFIPTTLKRSNDEFYQVAMSDDGNKVVMVDEHTLEIWKAEKER
jgi:WD40 repeat protein